MIIHFCPEWSLFCYRLVSTAAYGTRAKLYTVEGLAPVLHGDFIEVWVTWNGIFYQAL